MSTIYKTRYQAHKAMIGLKAIVKVCAPGYPNGYGYAVMPHDQYHIWRKQR